MNYIPKNMEAFAEKMLEHHRFLRSEEHILFPLKILRGLTGLGHFPINELNKIFSVKFMEELDSHADYLGNNYFLFSHL